MNKSVLYYRSSLILTTLALVLLSISFVQAKLTLTGYGLISSLPATFYAGIAILTIAAALLWVSKERHNWLLAIQTVFLIISLFLIPYIIEGTPRFPASYQNYGFVEYITSHGHMNPGVVWYHSYPGFPLFFATFFETLGITDPLLTMSLFPAIFEILLLLPFFMLLRSIKNDLGNLCWMAAWIFLIANWTSQDYFSPQAMSYLFMLYLIVLMIKRVTSDTPSVANSILIIIFMFSITITHTLTSIAALLILIGLTILWRKKDFSTLILFAVVIGAWAIYGAIFLVRSVLPTFLAQAFQPDQFFHYIFTLRFAETSPEHALINYIIVIFSAIFVIAAILGALWPSRESRISKINLSFVLMALCPLLMFPAFVYGGEIIIRVFLFLLVPVAYFTIKLMKTKLVIAISTVILILLLPVHILAQYGLEKGAYIPRAEIMSADFFFEYTDGGHVIGLDPPCYFKKLGEYKFAYISCTSIDPDEPNPLLQIRTKSAYEESDNIGQYVFLSNRVYNSYDYFTNNGEDVIETKRWIATAKQYNLIYVNPEVAVYVWE